MSKSCHNLKKFFFFFFHHTCESTCDTKQLLPPDRVLRELYIIYTPDQLRAETTYAVYA